MRETRMQKERREGGRYKKLRKDREREKLRKER